MRDELGTMAVIGLLLITSALFSAAEISFLSLGRHRARRVSSGRAGALTERLLARPATTLGAILATITALNYTAEAIAATWVMTRTELPLWSAIVGMAALIIIFAEVVPISYAAANSQRVARAAALPVWIASGVLSLPARGTGFIAERIAHIFGGRPRAEPPVTEGEIRAIVDLQTEAGGLEEEEKAMIHQIFEFGDKVAREVMVPRTDMVAIPDTSTVGDASRSSTERRVSRLPVYRDDLDHIVGVAHVKDVLPLLAAGRGDAPVASVLRPALRVPETKRLNDLLTEFRRRRRSLAIVVDEYGGTAGLVTLEDLLEEVVGDIYDEYDVVRPAIEQVGGRGIVLRGRMSISDASTIIGVALPEGDYDSLAGLMYSRLGTVPEPGQQVALEGVILVVDALERYRITRVWAVVQPVPESGP